MKPDICMTMIAFLSLALSCPAQQAPQRSQPLTQEITITDIEPSLPEPVYYIYKDGAYKETTLTKQPELYGGNELMETLIKLNIRYPDMAKEKKIGGTVLVSVVIDSEGNLEDAFIHEGIGGGCNDEALRAVRLLDETGFVPAEIKGKPVAVKYDIPITFLPK